jgi:uncharacterized YigZ family protein
VEQIKDSYLTIEGNAEAIFKEKSSKFLCYAYHIESEEEVSAHLEVLHKRYYDATHHCYAWRLGPFGERFRANDDGEPSSTAGKPILGQLLSREITNCLIVVVRYFGGIKLGVPGLINAYKSAAREALDNATIIEKTIDEVYSVVFDYPLMNEVMRVLKDESIEQQNPRFELNCYLEISVRKKDADRVVEKLKRLYGVTVEYLRTV